MYCLVFLLLLWMLIFCPAYREHSSGIPHRPTRPKTAWPSPPSRRRQSGGKADSYRMVLVVGRARVTSSPLDLGGKRESRGVERKGKDLCTYTQLWMSTRFKQAKMVWDVQ